MKPWNIEICDVTLRDGEQTPGVSFTHDEKMTIARALDEIGVEVIEAGFPVVSSAEKECVAAIARSGLSARVCCLARALRPDVEAALDCDVDMVSIFIATSDLHIRHKYRKPRAEVLDDALDMVEFAADHGVQVRFAAEDASRTDPAFLIEMYSRGAECGADLVSFADTVGCLAPLEIHAVISRILGDVHHPLCIHCHNDLGFAAANTITAAAAGAFQLHTTVNGIGERAGNAALEQVLVALRMKGGVDRYDLTRLQEISRLVARCSGVVPERTRPIVGENAFAHESGIHSHGVITRSDTFEPGIMTPEMVGHRRRLKLGKHAGRHAVRQMLAEVHMTPTDAQLDEIILRVKAIAGRGKRVTDADLYEIGESVMQIVSNEKTLELQDIAIMTGNHVIPTASVRATVDGVEHAFSSIGNGPVDAAVRAILGIIPAPVHLKEFNIEAISGGTDALGHVTITVEDERGRVFDASASSDDIILASVEAVINAINLVCRTHKLDREQEE